MATFKAKSGIYWIDIALVGVGRIRKSAKTTSKVEAEELEAKIKEDHRQFVVHGRLPEVKFDIACLEFLKESRLTKDLETKKRHVRYWLQRFTGRDLRSLKSSEIMQALPTHSAFVDERTKRELSNATINRHISSIKRIMSLAREREWIDRTPILKLLAEPSINVRFISDEESRTLINAFTQDWFRNLAHAALLTGMRRGEILGLKWSSVNLDSASLTVGAADAKSGKSRSVPLNDQALELIKAQVGKHPVYVFTKHGLQINAVDNPMWKRACAAAGIENFKFHDLRHTWASRHAIAGTPLLILQKMGGWETLQMVLKYSHLNDEDLKGYAAVSQITKSPTPALKLVNGCG
jgi:integrase